MSGVHLRFCIERTIMHKHMSFLVLGQAEAGAVLTFSSNTFPAQL